MKPVEPKRQLELSDTSQSELDLVHLFIIEYVFAKKHIVCLTLSNL